jgi:hypothetical protein
MSMKIPKLALGVALAALAACQDKKPAEPPKPAAAAAPAPAAAPAAATEQKAEEQHEGPDPHGMPGMADLFKDKKDEKK